MGVNLRPYQDEILDGIRTQMHSGVKAILLQSATGSGKTCLAAHMLGTASLRGFPSLFVVHRRELIKQSALAFESIGLRYGIIAAGFPADSSANIQIASIQTLAKRYAQIKRPHFIILDEAHHCPSASWSRLIKAYPEAFRVGLTATPERLDGAGLGDYFEVMVNGPSVSWLIEHGWLARYRLFAPASVSVDGVHSRMGDFVRSELSAAADKPSITGDVLKHYEDLAHGKRAVVFCVSIAHSQHVAAQFRAAGIAAEHVDGETPTDQRDAAMERFRRGDTLVLSNCELFGEGIDVPAMEVAILLRPTQSLGLHLQQCGRALRPHPGKEYALILDHAGNTQRHGLPDEDREWTLEGRKHRKKDDEADVHVKICPKCYAAMRPGPTHCRHCGHEFEVEGRSVEEIEGELIEVDPAVVQYQRKQQQYGAQSLEDLIALGKERGYKSPYRWARHIMQARQRKKLRHGRMA